MKVTGPLAEKGLHVFDSEAHVRAGHSIPRIWYVVADREKAHVYHKKAHELVLIADLRAAHGEKGGEGGYVFHVEGASRKGDHDPRGRRVHHGDMAFVHMLAEWLATAEREQVFDRLVIIAAPHTLGEIRESLPRNVHDRVTAEIDREMTGMPVKKIYDHLNDTLWF